MARQRRREHIARMCCASPRVPRHVLYGEVLSDVIGMTRLGMSPGNRLQVLELRDERAGAER